MRNILRSILLILGLVVLVGLVGCEDDEEKIVEPGKLSPPLGLYSITGDSKVTLFWWCSNYDEDLVGFKIYAMEGVYIGGIDPREEVPGGFEMADSLVVTTETCNSLQWKEVGPVTKMGPLTNGQSYSFLIVAAKGDDWREISHTSNIVVDTPRPESDVGTLYVQEEKPTEAGFDLADMILVDCTEVQSPEYTTPSGDGDIMCERFSIAGGLGERVWLAGINGAGVQDLGYMQDWDDADVAPEHGYAEAGHSIEAILGHIYAVKTGENHYGKIQVTGISPANAWIMFKAAYQIQGGNPEYK